MRGDPGDWVAVFTCGATESAVETSKCPEREKIHDGADALIRIPNQKEQLSMEIIVETFPAWGEASSSPVRVRPLPGQGFDVRLRVECSKSMREQYPVGTLFRLSVKRIYREGTPLLYAHYAAPFEQVSLEEAQTFIVGMYGSRNSEAL
jgi:hypothetical protein